MTDRDLTAGIVWFSGKSAERQILTPETAAVYTFHGWMHYCTSYMRDRERIRAAQVAAFGGLLPDAGALPMAAGA
jgi:hypothetical protein